MDAARPAPGGLAPGELGVVDTQGDVADTVSMAANMVGDAAVGAQRGGKHKADSPLLDYIRGAVPQAGFRSGPGDQRHAEGGSIVVSGLTGVADVKFEVISTCDGQKIMIRVNFRMKQHGRHGRTTPGSAFSCLRPIPFE